MTLSQLTAATAPRVRSPSRRTRRSTRPPIVRACAARPAQRAGAAGRARASGLKTGAPARAANTPPAASDSTSCGPNLCSTAVLGSLAGCLLDHHARLHRECARRREPATPSPVTTAAPARALPAGAPRLHRLRAPPLRHPRVSPRRHLTDRQAPARDDAPLPEAGHDGHRRDTAHRTPAPAMAHALPLHAGASRSTASAPRRAPTAGSFTHIVPVRASRSRA